MCISVQNLQNLAQTDLHVRRMTVTLIWFQLQSLNIANGIAVPGTVQETVVRMRFRCTSMSASSRDGFTVFVAAPAHLKLHYKSVHVAGVYAIVVTSVKLQIGVNTKLPART